MWQTQRRNEGEPSRRLLPFASLRSLKGRIVRGKRNRAEEGGPCGLGGVLFEREGALFVPLGGPWRASSVRSGGRRLCSGNDDQVGRANDRFDGMPITRAVH
jgi:hypothetical protein